MANRKIVNYNRVPKDHTTYTRPEGAGNYDNMDDKNIVNQINVLTGTVENDPIGDKNLINKKYYWDNLPSGVSFGTDNQIPFMNSAGNDFEYSSGLTFDGNDVFVGGGGDTTTPKIRLGEIAGTSEAYLRYEGTGNVLEIGTTLSSVDYPTIYLPRASGDAGVGAIPTRKFSVVDLTGATWINVKSGSSDKAGILLGDAESETAGQIFYNNLDNSMGFKTSNAEALHIDSVSTGGDIHLPLDDQKLYQGAGNDYSQYYDGANQRFDLTTGKFIFNHDLRLTNYGDEITFGAYGKILYNNHQSSSSQGLTIEGTHTTISSVNLKTNGAIGLTLNHDHNVLLPYDNQKFIQGAGDDYSQYYDGTDFIIDSSLVNPSDIKMDCGTNKTLELQHAVTDDMQIDIGAVKLPPSQSATITLNPADDIGLAVQFANASTESIHFNMQSPHARVDESDIEFHIHVTPGASTNTGNVRMSLEYDWKNINGTFGGTTTVYKTFAMDGTAHKHQYEDIATIDGTGMSCISSIICCKLTRLGSDALDTFTGDIYAVGMDFHVTKNTLGSRQETTK